MKKYADNTLVLQKPSHKEPYKEITYRQFGEDVVSFGTKLIKMLPKKQSKVVIVSGNNISMVCVIHDFTLWRYSCSTSRQRITR